MIDLVKRIKNKEKGILLYGFTPPKMKNSYEKNIEISLKRIERLKKINIDGLVIYDIQDESSRVNDDRPFLFLPTLEPMDYYLNYLKGIDIPPIIYQCVGKYSINEMNERLSQLTNMCTVLVGAPSKNELVKTTLQDAYLKLNLNKIPLGGVIIPERHAIKGDEYLRIFKKQTNGCCFFISQCIYDSEKFKNMVLDYYYYCYKNSIEMMPIIMTVSPCGSRKTVELLKWLGISIPKWIENDLENSIDTLSTSMELCKNIVYDVMNFCKRKNIIFGCNVESVSIKRDEVLASFDLAKDINEMFINSGIR